MGIDYHVSIGPYVECFSEKIEKTFTKPICTNELCKYFGRVVSTKFCGYCSMLIENAPYVKSVDKVSPEVLEKILNDRLYEVCLDVTEVSHIKTLISNRTVETSFWPKETGSFSEEITESDRIRSLEHFNKVHKEDLDKLRNLFGPENVVVKWGIVFTVG